VFFQKKHVPQKKKTIDGISMAYLYGLWEYPGFMMSPKFRSHLKPIPSGRLSHVSMSEFSVAELGFTWLSWDEAAKRGPWRMWADVDLET
jgi:hypothetical protein